MSLIIVLCIITLCLLYWWVRKRYEYWAKNGIPHIRPKFPFGTNNFNVHPGLRNAQVYREMKGSGPFCGLFNFFSPIILALDIDFIKAILVKDFQHFSDRGTFYNIKDDPLSATLFNIEGHHWKNLRSQLTPTFTSGKMKYMFPTVVKVGHEFYNVLSQQIDTNSEVEIKDLLARFTTDVIGNCAFGLECNSLKDPEAKFRQMGMKFFNKPRNSRIMQFVLFAYRDVGRKLGFKLVPDDVSAFFMSAVRDTVEYRVKNKVQRNDFMDLLIKLRNEQKSSDLKDLEMEGLSMNELAAQAWVFFLAGFETSSTAMSFALYELAQNQEIQEKARKSVTNALANHDNNFTYEAMQEMEYLEQCINESLRKYPPGSNLLRIVTKAYKVPGMNFSLPKGLLVMVPIYGLHHDEDFYPNPEVYDPERFSPEEVRKRNPYTFMPFGEGPRNCIGMRFGMMQAKVGLATLLKNFSFKLSKKTAVPLVIDPKSIVISALDSMYFDVQKL